MPIKRELRHFYGHAWRAVVRPRILRRAGGRFTRKGRYKGGARCEHCRAVDRSNVVYHADFPKHYFVLDPQVALFDDGRPIATCHERDGGAVDARWMPADLARYTRDRRRAHAEGLPLLVVVQIGICHLNHTPGDDRPRNLRALCRRCHLEYDELHHRGSRATRKDESRPLLREAS